MKNDEKMLRDLPNIGGCKFYFFDKKDPFDRKSLKARYNLLKTYSCTSG